MPIDDSNKTFKSFKRASLDATNKSLEPFSVNDYNVTTSLSFKEHQHRTTDKEAHLVSNPKRLAFELKVVTAFSVFTLINKIENFVANVPEAALCTGSLFFESVKRQMEAYSCLHKPTINGKR